ncbi:DUF4166 domain-containing protein [Virgibacillus ndiopensis]|uniref:DUF4166 domain-containing protein n=1 Tax=Virgibacillus ndiopensis TaxID=2004408 RepID=UPI001FE708CB|nr:DUF4166 domain-containing protein [Virgibacillus ndiopensis]
MSIFKRVMGEEFRQLHPMLQKRYEFLDKFTFIGTGKMKSINGGPKWLYPFFRLGVRWKLLFPEHGKDVRFKIVNSPRTGINGEEQIHWERVFYFEHNKRYFNALMSLDSKRNIIKDYLGEPPLFYSDLKLSATRNGDLKIESKRQRLVIGRLEIPLPKVFQGLATVTEKYSDEREVYVIRVVVRNPLIGTVFSYEGEFDSK